MKTHFYLFLDVDGVLHPARWGVPGISAEQARAMAPDEYELQAALRGFRATPDGPPFSCLPLFEATIKPFLGQLQVVITSSWRTKPELYEAILAAMSEDLRARVAGATPRDSGDYGRPAEINRWLREHGEPGSAAIVIDDDDTHEWRHLAPSTLLFRTVTEQGFVDEDAHCLAKLLSLDPQAFAALLQSLSMPCMRAALMDWAAERE